MITAAQIRSFRRRAGGLDERRPWGADALGHALLAGASDSMPRGALLSLHARLDGVTSTALDDALLTQVWGPRFSVYVVAADDVAPFTLGRLPRNARRRERAERTAEAILGVLGQGQARPYGEVGRAIGVSPNSLRYAAPTGIVRLRWDGARQPTIEVVAPPEVDPEDARRELARRWLRVQGPTTPDAFGRWAGVNVAEARTTFDAIADELVEVDTPVGPAFVLAEAEAALRTTAVDADPGNVGDDTEAVPNRAASAGPTVRLLPSGDAYWLLHGEQRELLVEDPEARDLLWTPRVWPGAVLVDGEIVGTWRRAEHVVTVSPWRSLSDDERDAIETEASSFPLPDLARPIDVR